MSAETWSHRLVRPMVRPLAGTPFMPNHLTTLRLLTGLGTCAALMPGSPLWTWWAGWLLLTSLLLDYADGELARLGGMVTARGHAYDYAVDNVVNSAFFVALGAGLRHSSLGHWAFGLEIISGVSVCLTGFLSEGVERRLPPAGKAWAGAFGFHPEDLLHLVAPLAWFDWLQPILVGAAVGAPVVMLVMSRGRQGVLPRAHAG